MQEGKDYYYENGYKVFTHKRLSDRGICCKSGCRHCPWSYRKHMKNKDFLYFDLDGVMCNYVKAAEEFLGDRMPPKGTPEWTEALNSCQYIPNFFLDLEPIPGAIEAWHKLGEKYECFILSAPSWDNITSWADKRTWAERHLGESVYKKVILTHNKGHFSGRALIDDRTKYGVDEFFGEHIHFGTEKFPDFDAVIKYLM